MPSNQPVLFVVGLNHRTSPVDVREQIFIRADETSRLLTVLKETLEEAVVISTCNRTEIYGVTKRYDLGLDHYKDLLIDFKNARGLVSREHFFGAVSCAACLQLFKVATSLDSRIVGDTQILGQVRDAYTLAERHGSTGKIINQLFQRSFKIGKKTLTDTTLHKGAISVSVAAAETLQRYFGSLANRTAMLIGAGNTARLAASALMKRKIGKLIIANRTLENAEALARELDSEIVTVIGLEQVRGLLKSADVLISSISVEEPILTKADLVDGKMKLVIDLGVPRNIAADVADIPGVSLKNIDDLNEIVDTNLHHRLANVPIANNIIRDEMQEFLIWYYSMPLLPKNISNGAKPDPEMKGEILSVKQFLFENLSWVHKAAMGDGADSFEGHAAVVDRLVAMRNSAAAAAR